MQLPEKYIGRILKFRADALRLELLTPDSGLATGGDWGDETPTTLLQNHLRDMFKSVEKLGGGGGIKLIRFHIQLIIRNLITEDAGILDRIMMLKYIF
jgi:hypothetical protein